VPQEGPATYDVFFVNTGNVPLSITADDSIGTFTLGLGETKTFVVSEAGPFSGSATADNTVTATGSYTPDSGNTRSDTQSDSASCDVGSRLNVFKTTNGQVNPDYDWTFAIYAGAHNGEGSGFLDDTPLATDTTLGDPDGILDFDNLNLDPGLAYTVCEIPTNATAGWTSEWSINGQTVPAYNPHFFDPLTQNLGYHCVDFGAGTGYPLTAGSTLVFDVDNSYPGGEPRTPGFWKNWSSCTGGSQYDHAVTNDPDNEFWALDELLYDPGFTIGILSLNDGDCVNAVSILDQRDIDSGKKKSSDSAYTLAMHLFAYELNQAAGACQSDAADQAAAAAQQLLFSYDFDGTGSYLRPKGQTYDDYYYALDLKDILDDYNNGLLCNNGSGEPQEGTVSGHIYEDTNGDGTQDAGEPGLAGVDVVITDSQAGTRTVTTDANGDYSAIVPAGSTTVDVDETTLSTGLDTVPTDGTDPTTINVIADINNYTGVVGYKPSSQNTNTMHIGNLEGASVPGSRGKWDAEVTVTLHKGDHSVLSVAGATVSGSWSGSGKGTGSCVTNVSGQCTITKSNVRGDSVTLAVTGVSLAGYTYNDGDNDESIITVVSP
jgi:hypothetical protein